VVDDEGFGSENVGERSGKMGGGGFVRGGVVERFVREVGGVNKEG